MGSMAVHEAERIVRMKDAEKIIADFEAWCDGQDESCPVVCLDALSLMKEQRTENKIITANNAELDKQRTAFAMKIEELKTEVERLKDEAKMHEADADPLG